jgi:hypothetical protein
MKLIRNREYGVWRKTKHMKVCGKITTSANPPSLLFFLLPFSFFLAAQAVNYGRGLFGVAGTPLVRGRGFSGVVGTPLSFGRGFIGFVATPLEYAMAAFVAAMATIVTINERKRRAFDDIIPP